MVVVVAMVVLLLYSVLIVDGVSIGGVGEGGGGDCGGFDNLVLLFLAAPFKKYVRVCFGLAVIFPPPC